jgi:hypothetical protein
MHGKSDDAGRHVVRSHTAEKRRTGPAVPCEIYHHYSGTVPLIELVPVFEVVGVQEWRDPGVCKKAPAYL